MSKYSGSGWHFQSVRHSNARKYGRAGGTYSFNNVLQNKLQNKNYRETILKEVLTFMPNKELYQAKEEIDKEIRLSETAIKEGMEKRNPQPSREYGFDLTGFKSAEDFKSLLKSHGLTKYKIVKHYYDKESSYNVFTWKNADGTLELRTGNNPITGEYNQPKMRENEIGYASYMGIKGDNDKVEALAKDIKSRATEVKDEDPKHNIFIW